MTRTNNPVLDAEVYQQEIEERPHIECEICHGYIYKGDDWHDGDIVYKIDGLQICEECIGEYLKGHRRELI